MWMPSRTKSWASVLMPGASATSTPAASNAAQMLSQSSCLFVCMPLAKGDLNTPGSKLTRGGPLNRTSDLSGSAAYIQCHLDGSCHVQQISSKCVPYIRWGWAEYGGNCLPWTGQVRFLGNFKPSEGSSLRSEHACLHVKPACCSHPLLHATAVH